MPEGPADTRASVIPALRYRDAAAAVERLCKAFGFEKRLVVPADDGNVVHAQLVFGNGMVMRSVMRVVLAALLLLAAGCVSSGRDFPAQPITKLEVGRTTQAQVREAFGEPWRTGLEDGQRTWTYGQYRYSLFGAPMARDLKLKFNASGLLTTYTYSSTERDLP